MTHLVVTARASLFVPSTPVEKRLVASLWSVRSPLWSGYMDFQDAGHYFTHWGFGTWRTIDDRHVRLQNTYDPFWFELAFDDDLLSFTTRATNHGADAKLVGDMIWDYAKQVPPAPFWK